MLAWITASGFSAFVFGFLADVIGRRKVLVLGQALFLASWFIIGFSPSLTWDVGICSLTSNYHTCTELEI